MSNKSNTDYNAAAQAILGRQFPVLDKGYVELQSIMGTDLSIVNAARTSVLGESKGEQKDKRLLMYLYQHRHTSPFEMCELKLRIKAPVVVWWQLTRHRTLSINMQSGRYMEFEPDEFYIPAHWRVQSSDNKQGSAGFLSREDSDALSLEMIEAVRSGFHAYQKALKRGVAKEMARFFLPAWVFYYVGVVKVDAHNLMRFLRLRAAQDAQWEIRQYAMTIRDEIFSAVLPWTFEAYSTFES